MTTVVIVIAAAAVGYGLSWWWRVPYAPLLLAIGIALNAAGAFPSAEEVRAVLLLGVTFITFFVGAELNIHHVGDQKASALLLAVTKFLVLGALGLAAALLLNTSLHTALYVALAITVGSSLMVVSLLRQRQQVFEPFGRLVIGMLLFGDMLVIVLLVLLTRAEQGLSGIAAGALSVLALLAMTGVFLRWISPWLLVRLKLDDESELLTILATLFLFVGAAYWLALPVVAGAFLAGVALSAFPVAGIVRSQVNSLANFFLCLFFVAMGASVTLLQPRQLMLDVALLAGILLLMPLVIGILARRAGLNLRSSIEASLLLAQCGEFSIITVLVGVSYGHVGQNTLSAIVLVTVVTMMLTPALASDRATWRLMRWLRSRDDAQLPMDLKDHVLLLGCSRRMFPLLEYLAAQGEQVVVVDDDRTTVDALRSRGLTAVRGDGADDRTLQVSSARSAKVVVSAMRRQQDHLRVLDFMAGQRPVLVRVFDPAEGARLQAQGASVVVEADAAAEDLIRWFQQWSADDDRAPAGQDQ